MRPDSFWVGYTLSMPPQTRAQCYKKRKPAERELLTAGVEGVDTLDATLLRSRNTVKSKKINFASPLLRSVPLIHERTLAKLSHG